MFIRKKKLIEEIERIIEDEEFFMMLHLRIDDDELMMQNKHAIHTLGKVIRYINEGRHATTLRTKEDVIQHKQGERK